MRAPIYLLAMLMVVVTAFWSYRMTYATQDRFDAVRELRRDIARERSAIAVLSAEWAYLTAPARLERLVAENRTALELRPMTPADFADAREAPAREPDDGLAPVAIIDMDDLAPPVVSAPRPRPRPVLTGSR